MSPLRSSYDRPFAKKWGFSRVHKESDTPLGTNRVRKTVDVVVNEESRVNKVMTSPLEKRDDDHATNVSLWV